MNSGTAGRCDAGAATIAPIDSVEAKMADGASLVLRRMSNSPALRLVLSHGNGLAINGYEEFWKRLLPEAEVIVFDYRNHGMNPPAPPSQANNWMNFVSDLDEVIATIEQSFGPKPTYGVFHSMSALTSLMHASQRPHPWKGLVLFEPPAVPAKGQDREDTLRIHHDLASRTRNRRTEFAGPDELSNSFARFLMFQRMSAQARFQLAAATLRPTQDCKFELCCPPDFEADTFCVGEIESHWEKFAQIDCPVLIVSSAPETSDTPVLSNISRLLALEYGFEHVELPDTGHLLQLDKPDVCAGLTLEFVQRTS